MVKQLGKALSLLVLSLMVGSVVEGGHPSAAVHLAALAAVVIGTATAVLLSQSPVGVWRYFSAAFGRESDPQQLILSYRYFSILGQRLLFMGGIGFLLGMVHILQYAGDTQQAGKGLAIAILCPVYAVVLKLLISDPLRASCLQQLRAPKRKPIGQFAASR